MKYAVIQSGGKQYKVSEGDTITVERLPQKAAEKISFSDVLLYVSDGEVALGTPYVAGQVVMGEVLESFRGSKIRVSKFKAKVRYRRVTGHRQALTKIKITQIGTKSAKEAKVEAETSNEGKTEKKVTKKAKNTTE